jgi:tetrahydromethanopterin S-methyltransferase subunit F
MIMLTFMMTTVLVPPVADAIRAYLESLRKDGQPIPRDKKITADLP